MLYDTEELGDGSLYIIQGEFFLHGLVQGNRSRLNGQYGGKSHFIQLGGSFYSSS